MTTLLEIGNMALAHLGGRAQIADMTEDSSERIQFSLFYENTRDELLGMAYWNFAKKVQTLAIWKAAPGTAENTSATTSSVWLSTWPPPGFLYSYLYPSDTIAARYVVPQISTLPGCVPLTSAPAYGPAYPLIGIQNRTAFFEVAFDNNTASSVLKVINTNAPQAILCYTRRITEIPLFDALFVNALAAACAAKMAMPLSGNQVLSNRLFGYANASIEMARKRDGNEGTTVQDVPTDWIAARGIPIDPWNAPQFVMPYNQLYSVF